MDNSVRLRNFRQTCSLQTSTGTTLMHLVEEKIGVTVVDEEDELVLDFCRLAGGAVGEPPVLFAEAIFQKEQQIEVERPQFQ
jgi:hypothetical protein